MATGLTALIGTLVGQVAGAIKPVSLASLTASLGVTFTIPRGRNPQAHVGLRHVPRAVRQPHYSRRGASRRKPQVNLVSTNVDPSVMTLTTFDPVKGRRST